MLILALACSRSAPLPAGDVARPDVVLVSIDTLRADHVSAYGAKNPTTPFLDRLAAEGVRFAHARSPAPWTLPSHATMLTGQLPARHRVIEDDLRLSPEVPMLQERMKAAGYATGGFVATFYLSRIYGFERGFDAFEDFGLHDEKVNLKGEVTASEVVDEALRWMGTLPAGEPAFIFLHVYDAHYAYDPPAPYDTLFDRAPEDGDARYKKYEWHRKHPLDETQLAHQRAQYDESIRYVDDQLARLQGALAAAGRSARWVVSSDHGEEFGERGSWGHAHTLYAEQLHVPLIVAGPGVPAGRVVQDVVGLHDVAPTVATLAGATGLEPDGIDLGPLMAGVAAPLRVFLGETSRFSSNRVSLLSGALRLEWDLVSGRRELFDVIADPKEAKDLALTQPDALARLTTALESALGAPWEAREEGKIVSDGAILAGGRVDELLVRPGQRFAVLPHDAAVRVISDGVARGPWSATGGVFPTAVDPVAVDSEGLAGEVKLNDEQREALEALGYVQDDQE